MVFPSVPVYLDPPSWNQQQAQQPASGGGEVQQFPPGGAVPRPEGLTGGPIRPGSMADRARPAKFPHPEIALKCPRCDSTNTKFCYFNNYSLSQPRHFCKTCRRYWTRGGALRNVPVGGGCRRNKRSKAGSGSSKSQTTTVTDRQSGASSSASTATSMVGGAIPHTVSPASQLPFMPSLYPLADYSLSNIGLNFSGIQSNDTADYQVGGSSSTGMEQWRFQPIQQFPFFGGLEVQAPAAPTMGFYPFDSEGGGVDESGFAGQVHTKPSTSGLITQMASVKMEDNLLGLNLQRQYLGVPRNDQYWGGGSGGGGGGSSGGNNGGGWMTDLSGFNSSPSGNLL